MFLLSRLMWPRGLKYDNLFEANDFYDVEAYVASWIEIHIPIFKTPFPCVEAYVASWIEIISPDYQASDHFRRGLCGLVD